MSKGLFTRSREPNSRSGAATTATPAIQVADHIGRIWRPYSVCSGSLGGAVL